MAIANDKIILGYPLELGSKAKDEFGYDTQYVIITIVTDEKSSKLRGDTKYSDVFTTQNTSRVTGIGSVEKNTDPDVTKLYGQQAVDSEKFVKQKGVVKLNKAIVLPMPNDHIVGTSIEYSQVDSTLLSKAGEFFTSEFKSGVISDLSKLGKNKAISSIVNTFKSGATNERALLAEERIVSNPRKEILLDGFGFRRFSFRYSFAPRNELESNTVNEIIQTMRFYSSPELSPGKIFYLFPAEFNINFMRGQEINPNIPKIAPSVLERISVNYSPNGVWATLPNAAPVQLDITMDFLELELIDRNRIFKEDSPISSGY